MQDLTNKAIGAVLGILIIRYVGTRLVLSRMMANPQMDKTQQRLIMLMPLFFAHDDVVTQRRPVRCPAGVTGCSAEHRHVAPDFQHPPCLALLD